IDASPGAQHIFHGKDRGCGCLEGVERRGKAVVKRLDGFEHDTGDTGDDQNRQRIVESARERIARLFVLENNGEPATPIAEPVADLRAGHGLLPEQREMVAAACERFLMAVMCYFYVVVWGSSNGQRVAAMLDVDKMFAGSIPE